MVVAEMNSGKALQVREGSWIKRAWPGLYSSLGFTTSIQGRPTQEEAKTSFFGPQNLKWTWIKLQVYSEYRYTQNKKGLHNQRFLILKEFSFIPKKAASSSQAWHPASFPPTLLWPGGLSTILSSWPTHSSCPLFQICPTFPIFSPFRGPAQVT